MDRSSNENLLAKRPRRCVQSKLSFSVFSEASELDGARPPSPTLAAADGRSTSDGGENETKRKRSNTKKPHGGHPKETADSNKEAQKVCSYSRKGNRALETRRSGRKKASPIKHIDLNSKRSCLNSKSDNVKDCNEGNLKCCQIFSDLWSEAKKAAEENLRLSAGKQTHPFFSICRATKKPLGTNEIEKQENFSWLDLDGDYSVSLPPVHVSEFVKDGVGVPDWKNWEFVERRPTELGGYCSVDLSSVFEGSIKSLSFEAACAKEKELDHFFVDDKMNSEDKSKPFYEPASTGQLHSHFKMDHFGCNICSPSAHVSSVNVLDQYGAHKGSLWTDKYRPEISMEVCGNTESVKLLSDWLKSWQERGTLNSKNDSIIEYSDGSSYDGGSDIDELVVGDTLKNVLLITGPVGSGKSAAIYACAKEQGFKVIEVNASCLRNGAYMRQTFGEGVDSLGLTNWLAEDETLKTLKHPRVLQPGTFIDPEDGCQAHSNEMSPRTCSREHTSEKSSYGHIANKTLFLFEEVDVVFEEDHGFISSILKLAETTKRPIILTSNNKHPCLPQLLDRLILEFKAPSYTELLSHLSMVCGFERVHISCNLLERIIKACLGDIRRILILLQFWCQGMGEMAEKYIRYNSNLMPFDIIAVHLAMPKVIPWDFHCDLSAAVEEEISRAVSAPEESSIMSLVLQKNTNSCETIDPSEKLKTPTAAKNRKKGKLRKHSNSGQTQVSDQMNVLEDFLGDSNSPANCIERTAKHRRCLVLSSQSDDGLSSDELKLVETSARADVYNDIPTSQGQEINGPSEVVQMDNPTTDAAIQDTCGITEVSSTSRVCDTAIVQDLSCISESSFLDVLEATPNFSSTSNAVFHNLETTNLFDLNISSDILPVRDNADAYEAVMVSGTSLDNHSGMTNAQTEFPQCQDIERLDDKEVAVKPSQCQLLDECSHAGFSLLEPRESISCSQEAVSVPETWRKLRSRHTDLKLLLSNSKDVTLVTGLTSGLADLISEADIMFRNCNMLIHDNLEPSSTPCEEPDSFSWYNEHVEMGSTFAQHGVCYYTTKYAAAGSCSGCNTTSDLAEEILASSTNSTVLGKLLLQESSTGQSRRLKDAELNAPQTIVSSGRESEAELYKAILPIVPTRLSMVLRGAAFHEYLSFIGHMSRSECSRLAEGSVENPKRRSRTSLHYLCSGAHQLSLEQTELLARRSCFGRGG